jgi:MOSC domain-containing protein YiiM
MSSGNDAGGRIVDIFIARRGGQPVERVDEIEALKDRGLAGDRFVEGTSYWSGVDECQVTLIALESLEEIATTTEVSLMEGQHRRNIVTSGSTS